MTESKLIDAVLTEDESQLVTIINGLEEQADMLESQIEKVQSASGLMIVGSAAFLGLYFLETNTTDRLEYYAVSAT